MYVHAPHRSTNGLTTIGQVTGNVDRGYYPTLAQALLNSGNVSSSSLSGWSSGTYRGSMSSGRVSHGKFVNTSYLAIYVRNVREQDYIHVHQVSPVKYYVVRRPLGWGYDGMGGAGCGSPWLQFEPEGTNGRPAAIANRAIMQNLKQRAEVECLIKAKDQKLDLSETLVDIGKTISMVAYRAQQVISAYRHARAGRLGKAAATLGLSRKEISRRGIAGNSKAIANGWLEMQYGWKPVLNDIFNGIRAVNEGLAKDPNHTYVVRRLSEGLPFVNRDVSFVWASESLTAHADVDVEVKYRFRLSDANLAYLTGLGLENPLYLAWVAMPMSFIVDWLVPVSDWLSAISAPLGLTFVSGYCSMRTHGYVQVTRDRLANLSPLVFLQPAIGRSDFAFLKRSVYSGFPIPKLYFRFPINNLERAANAVALFITTNRGR